MSHYYTQHPVDAIPDCLHCCQRPLQKVGLQAAHRRGRAVGKAGPHCPQQRNGKLHALRDLRPLCTSSRSSRFRTHLLGTRLLFLQASFNFCFLFFVFLLFLKNQPCYTSAEKVSYIFVCILGCNCLAQRCTMLIAKKFLTIVGSPFIFQQVLLLRLHCLPTDLHDENGILVHGLGMLHCHHVQGSPRHAS